MEAAVGVFHHLKANLLGDADRELDEFPSEYSDDYNSSQNNSGNGKILTGSRRTVSCHHLPSSPVSDVSSPSAFRRKVYIDDGVIGRGDSGFNSDQNSSVVYSDCLENYGLDGPIPDCSSHEDSQEPSQISEDKNSDFQPPPSVTSSTTRKRREKEVKQATIRQHYYPEGGWGYIVLLSAFLVNILAHGLQLSFGILLVAIQRRWASQVSPVSASEYPDIFCLSSINISS